MSDYRIKLNSGLSLDLDRNDVDMIDYDNNHFQLYAVVWVTDDGECVNELDFPHADDRDEYMDAEGLDGVDWYDIHDCVYELTCSATGERFECRCDIDVKTVAA